ncbi:MAG: hypothetical protein M9894_12775 [Planctomycetes bacterium]|nr:hypothetical protein [Planctomycetota bacterium]
MIGTPSRTRCALEAGGELSLTPALFPALLSEEERRAAVDDPSRGPLLFLELAPPPDS